MTIPVSVLLGSALLALIALLACISPIGGEVAAEGRGVNSVNAWYAPFSSSSNPWTRGIKFPDTVSKLINGVNKVGASFSWSSCGDGTDKVTITALSVEQTTGLIFRIKGKCTVGSNITAPIKGNLEVSKKMFWGWTTIPCMDGFGSCNFADVCSLSPYTKDTCPQEMKDQNLPCSCPIVQGSYDGTVHMDLAVMKLPSWLEKGWYRIKATLTDSQEEIVCVQMDLTVK